jgi:hypothetical protein
MFNEHLHSQEHPSRFIILKSGLGVCTGVAGLRFGTGPRGDYVHMLELGGGQSLNFEYQRSMQW